MKMTLKGYWTLFRLIDKTKNLGERRSPMFEKNRAMKWFGYLFAAFWLCYLMFFGVVMGQAMSDGPTEGFDTINGGVIFFLAADFLLRLFLVDTPAQEVKQFKLMPISINFLLNVFMIRRATTLFNIVWLFFFVPFGLFQVVHFYGFLGFMSWCFALWLIFVANAYWYLLWRTFLNRNILFVAIPVALYGIVIYLGIFDDKLTQMIWGKENIQPLFNACLWAGRWAMEINPVAYLIPLACIAVMYYANLVVQRNSIYKEIAEVQAEKVKSREMAFLNRFGVIGEYLKLEVKSVLRNAVVRKQFLTGIFMMVMLSFVFAFTSVYDNSPFMKAYISMYCFGVLGVVTLTGVMSAEGNYIDGLMARKESVLSLLKAKYYFHLCVMIIPFTIFMVAVFMGKNTFMEAIGCLLFTAGIVFPFLFQMAVYNNHTIDLNAKLTRQGGSNKWQIIVSMLAMFVPMIIMYAFMVFIPKYEAIGLAVIGAIGIALHPIWLRNVYNRFMQKRYDNMDSFRNSRNNK